MRCDFEVVAQGVGFIAIRDLDQGRVSVTNDAQNVVRHLTTSGHVLPGTRIVYRDTEGVWDELHHDGCGRFTSFGTIGGRDLADALVKIGISHKVEGRR